MGNPISAAILNELNQSFYSPSLTPQVFTIRPTESSRSLLKPNQAVSHQMVTMDPSFSRIHSTALPKQIGINPPTIQQISATRKDDSSRDNGMGIIRLLREMVEGIVELLNNLLNLNKQSTVGEVAETFWRGNGITNVILLLILLLMVRRFLVTFFSL